LPHVFAYAANWRRCQCAGNCIFTFPLWARVTITPVHLSSGLARRNSVTELTKAFGTSWQTVLRIAPRKNRRG
jgi:hypothetical protein